MRSSRFVAVFFLLMTFAGPSHAQEDVETTESAKVDEAAAAAAQTRSDQLNEKIGELRDAVREIDRTMDERKKEEGITRARLFDDAMDKREALHDELEKLAPELKGDEKLEQKFKSLLRAESQSIQEGIRFLQRENMRLNRDLQRAIELVTVARLEGQIADQKARVVALSEDLLRILEAREELGEDVKASREELDELLVSEARDSVNLLKELRLEIETYESLKDDDKEAKRRLQLLKARLRDEARTLRSVSDLLEKRGVDVSEYQKAVIENTGEVTSDVLDVDVLGGLAQKSIERGKEWAFEHGPAAVFKLLLLLLVLFVANLANKLTQKLVKRSLQRTHLSELAKKFVVVNAGRAVFGLGVLIALSQVGVDMGAFIAGLGIAGFIVGFALQDTLSNFASGIMILGYRPYDMGDLIEVAGAEGRVSHMSIVSTHITTLDNQRLVVPNNKVWQDVIRNVTAAKYRRVDLMFGISYADDFEKAEDIIKDVISGCDLAMTGEADPEHLPTVKLHNLGDSSLDIVTRVWTPTETYWDVHWHMLREVKKRFDAEGISIPFPQRDVHLYTASGAAEPADSSEPQAAEPQATETSAGEPPAG